MDEELAAIRADFDRIARLTDLADSQTGSAGLSGAGTYDDVLLSLLPARSARALEVGCGAGGFTRRLAARADEVTAIDLSAEMIRMARTRLAQPGCIAFGVADFLTMPLSEGTFDCAVSIATLHHLPFELALDRMAHALRPGGTLLVHDLFRDSSLFDRLLGALAFGVRQWRALIRKVRGRPAPRRVSAALRAAWADHARLDSFLTVPEVRRRAAAILPGVQVKRHLEWRYTLVWRKPDTGR